MVLAKGRESRVAKMAGRRRLPILADNPTADVKRHYGISRIKSHLLFGADGCLVAAELPPSATIVPDPHKLIPALRGESTPAQDAD